jgi:hypothetical protein
MESWEKWDINGYHRKVMESDRFENPALDSLDDSIVEVWCAQLFLAPTPTCYVRSHQSSMRRSRS